jgi:hypothetical protein
MVVAADVITASENGAAPIAKVTVGRIEVAAEFAGTEDAVNNSPFI